MGRGVSNVEHQKYGDKLQNDDIIVSHVIHSLLQLRDKQELLIVRDGMSPTELHLANYEWLQGLIDRFQEKRNYKIKPESVTEALYWFLMGYRKTK